MALRRIPAWLLAAIGAGLIILAVALTFLWTDRLRNQVSDLREEMIGLDNNLDRMWRNHTLGDTRQAFARMALSEALSARTSEARNYNLLVAANEFQAALMSMLAAGDAALADGPPESVTTASALLVQGDLSGATNLGAQIDAARLASRDAINALSERNRSLSRNEAALSRSIGRSVAVVTFLNVIGLVLLLLRDLPLWDRGRRADNG